MTPAGGTHRERVEDREGELRRQGGVCPSGRGCRRDPPASWEWGLDTFDALPPKGPHGAGSRDRFRPARSANAGRLPGTTPSPSLPSGTRAGAQPAILVVDDRPANLLAIEAILGALEADLLTATSGFRALALLEDRRPADRPVRARNAAAAVPAAGSLLI